MASASVAYLGAFTSSYRIELLNTWEEKCKELEIPSSESFRYFVTPKYFDIMLTPLSWFVFIVQR